MMDFIPSSFMFRMLLPRFMSLNIVPALIAAAAQIGSSVLQGRSARRAASAQRVRAEELQELISQIANRLRGAPGIKPSPYVSQLEPSLGNIMNQLIQLSGEDIFRRGGNISQYVANQILEGAAAPGKRFEDITKQTTEAALENLTQFFGRRGISPQSPLVVSEGRREARDVAIRNALARLEAMNQDISRAESFGRFSTGLQREARTDANALLQSALGRQAAGETAAAGIERDIPLQLAPQLLKASGVNAASGPAVLADILQGSGGQGSDISSLMEAISGLIKGKGTSRTPPFSSVPTLAKNIFGIKG